LKSQYTRYEYNNKGLRTRLTYPDDSYVDYEYDALSRLRKVKYNGSTIAQYEYDELSRRTLLTLGNGANAVYEYDLGNRLTKLTNNINGSTIKFDYNSYDKVGNRKSCKIDNDNAQVYSYDNLYQLIYVDYNDGDTANYYYDSLGNRTKVTNGEPNVYYKRNSLNQYTSIAGAAYVYDANGNLADDGTYLYCYDCENRLTRVKYKSTGGTMAWYDYDYLGRRVRKTISGYAAQKYCYDGDQVIAKYTGPGNVLRSKFVYGPGIDEPIMMIDVTGGNKIYYYHFDGLGSVVALSDVNSVIVERYSYDVFGEPNRTSDVNNPYMFTGRHYDSEVGLYYYRARYYSPYLGRFLQTDPIRYRAGLNLYTYCGNNPLNWVDPLGLVYIVISNQPIKNQTGILYGGPGQTGTIYENVPLYRVGVYGEASNHVGKKFGNFYNVTRDTASDSAPEGDRTPQERSDKYCKNHETPPGKYHGSIYHSPKLGENTILLSDEQGGHSIGDRSYLEIHHGPGMSEGCFLGQTGSAGQQQFINQVQSAIDFEKSQGTYNGIWVLVLDRY
jgi:RHS repeat-associated protein